MQICVSSDRLSPGPALPNVAFSGAWQLLKGHCGVPPEGTRPQGTPRPQFPQLCTGHSQGRHNTAETGLWPWEA